MESKKIGTALRTVRAARSLSQGSVADAAQISRAHLSLIEAGRRNPSLRALTKLACALNVDPDDVLRIAKDPIAALGIPVISA